MNGCRRNASASLRSRASARSWPISTATGTDCRPSARRPVEIDSNSVENLTRPIALTRKNALFAGHDEGGRSWARIASPTTTTKVNGVEPFAYLKATLQAIANGHPQSRLDDLLPWNSKPSS